MSYVVIAAISIGFVFLGCMVMFAGALVVVVAARKKAPARPSNAVAPVVERPAVAPEALVAAGEAPAAVEPPSEERDTKPQRVLSPDVVSDILEEEHHYAMTYGDDVATSVRPEVRLAQKPLQTPKYDLPFELKGARPDSTRVTRAADYEPSVAPLPMPVPPPDLEPIPELEPTQLMEHRPDF